MKTLIRPCSILLLVAAWLAVPGASPAQGLAARLTPELLQGRIAAAEASTELDESSRARLIDLYRQALNNLEVRRANEAAAEGFREAGRRAPAETEALRTAIERRSERDVALSPDGLARLTSSELSRLLDEEAANLTAVEAKLSVLEAQLESAARRPTTARMRIAATRARLEELAAGSGDPPSPDQPPQVAEAARWASETLMEALRTEIAMLDQELLSHASRSDLLHAKRDDAALGVVRIRERLEILRAALRERRRQETEVAMEQARTALEGASSGNVLVREVAESNLALAQGLQRQIALLGEVVAMGWDWPSMSDLDGAFRNARRKLRLESSRTPVGLTVLAERSRFPERSRYQAERRRVSRYMVDVSLRLLELQEERRSMADMGAYLDRRLAESGALPADPVTRRDLEHLVETRRRLLDRAIVNESTLQQRLYELDDTLLRLVAKTEAFDEFLAEHLLWARSNLPADRQTLARLPGEVVSYLRPGPWLEAARLALVGMARSPALLLMMALALGLAAGGRRIHGAVLRCGQDAGPDQEGAMGRTARALAFTLLLVAPVPLALCALGWALAGIENAALFPRGVGSALLRTAAWITLPILVRALFMRGGVAERHLGWNEDSLARMRRQLTLFVAYLFPLYFVLRTSLVVEPPAYAGGTLTLLCYTGINLGLLALLIGMGHPTRGSARRLEAAESPAAWRRWGMFGFPLAAALMVGLIILAWVGYSYAAQQLSRRVVTSVWILVGLWLVAALAMAWLTGAARQLHRQGVAEPPEFPAPRWRGVDGIRLGVSRSETDLAALGADSRQLVNAAILLVGFLALAWVWGDVLPALGILNGVHLWSQTALVDGVEQSVPVSLLDLLLAAAVALGGALLARDLPSVLDIILLRQGAVSASGRYTVGTLTRYAITAVTVLVALGLLGASASQLGWAAAALGVGIGFGLQEIVANFICGLILLFERPVRIGDVVTVGDASGMVAKIRIRATTIRDWEQKELVVPNKELITGRLLNWTLSDAVTRVFITVGVAYGSDVEKAMGLILEAAVENPLVLEDPEPRVHFEQFGDSSLHLTLRAYTRDVADRLTVTTELHQAIDRKFRAAGVVIAFPQRDVHFYATGGGGTAQAREKAGPEAAGAGPAGEEDGTA